MEPVNQGPLCSCMYKEKLNIPMLIKEVACRLQFISLLLLFVSLACFLSSFLYLLKLRISYSYIPVRVPYPGYRPRPRWSRGYGQWLGYNWPLFQSDGFTLAFSTDGRRSERLPFDRNNRVTLLFGRSVDIWEGWEEGQGYMYKWTLGLG